MNDIPVNLYADLEGVIDICCIDLSSEHFSDYSILTIVEFDGTTSETVYYDFDEWIEALSLANSLLKSDKILGYFTREFKEKQSFYTKGIKRDEI